MRRNAHTTSLWATVALSFLLFCIWGAWMLHQDEVQDLLVAAPLPAYHLEVEQPHHDHRPEPGVTHLPHFGVLSLTLRPTTQVKGVVMLRAYLIRDGIESPWPVPFATAPTGTFRLRAPLASLPDLRPGRAELRFVLQRSSAPQDTRILRVALEIHSGPSAPPAPVQQRR